MKKTILLVALFAVTAAIVYIGCGGDGGVQDKTTEISDLLGIFTGGDTRDTRYTLTVNVTPSNSGTVSRNPSNTSYSAGSQVTVTAGESNGYRFIGWSGASNDTAATVTITMDGNQTLTANFVSTSVATYTLSVNATPGGGNVYREPNKTRYNAGERVTVTAEAADGYTFAGWTGSTNETDASITITMNSDMALAANFISTAAATYILTVNAIPSGGGNVYRSPNKTLYNAGEEVTVTAEAVDGYTFAGWTGATNETDASITITMNNNMALTANFLQNTYSLFVNASPTQGGTVSRSPNKSAYTYGEPVTVTATPAAGYAFDGYTGAVTSTSAGVTVTIDGDKTLTANFKQQTAPSYTLSTVANPAVNAISISRSPDKASYTQGEPVTVTAPTVDGYTFTGWSGAATSTGNTVTITMDANKSLTANYRPLDYTLYVEIIPAVGGTVSRNPNNNAYTYNQSVNLTATPAAGYRFTGWSGAASGTYTSTSVTMNANKSVTATFEQNTYTLNTEVGWQGGGSVYRSPNKNTYTYNEQVTVTATPATGYTFAGWSGAAAGTTNPITIMMNDNKTLTANFQQQQATTYTLTTNVSPVGSGSVSRSPNQTTYAPGTNVTVTATPANGYTFKGWSGASSSANATVTITMDGDKTLTAGFGMPDAKRFTVYFNGNGATDGANPPQAATADSGASISLPGQQTMVKTGYSFGGWNTNSFGTGTFYNAGASYPVNGNSTLYAKWIPIYTVTFSGNGTTVGVPLSVSVDSGTVITIPGQGSMTRSGYSFGRWNTTSTGTGTNYNVGASYTVTSNATIYVKWIPIYTVTFNGNGTTVGVPEAVSVDSGTVITIPGQGSMTRSGYSFGRWNTNSTGTGTNYSVGASYTVTGNATLYVKWIPIYKVTFNGNGTTDGIPEAISVDSGTAITLPSQGSMARNGYIFDGWNTTSGGTGNNYSASYTVTSNVTLYAKWTAIYTLTTNVSPSGGGTVSRNPDQTYYTSGTSVTVTATAASDYLFADWSGASTSTDASVTITMNGNKTLTAIFHPGFIFTDTRDNKTYKAVKIGNRTWMAKNLNYVTSSDSRCYNNSSANCEKYGRLYRPTIFDTICPAGWRLPYVWDWDDLEREAGGSAKKLKSKTEWGQGTGRIGTDDFGFSALPGGSGFYDFEDIEAKAVWMTSGGKIAIGMTYFSDEIFHVSWQDVATWVQPYYYGQSVRCVMND